MEPLSSSVYIMYDIFKAGSILPSVVALTQNLSTQNQNQHIKGSCVSLEHVKSAAQTEKTNPAGTHTSCSDLQLNHDVMMADDFFCGVICCFIA